ncbi:MAG: hypothetical protein FWD71_11735 [Oscillospiraceae bacterium]|nr:hypothetical protein [Oscillospiraceae bacterium]
MNKIKIVKLIITGTFIFFLAYTNKNRIPMPTELRTFDFITSSGVDINLNNYSDFENLSNKSNSKNFSISYISSAEVSEESDKSNENKNIFNVRSATLNGAIRQLQSLTNKSLNDSHLEYILIGEKTAKENLGYFVQHYSKSPSIHFGVNAFVTKDMTSEEFMEKILTSEIDADARINGLLNDKTQISSMTKINIKDLLQIFYSKNKTGLIPALEVIKSPVKNEGKSGDESNNSENPDKEYTFEFYGLGIIKDGKLADYLENSLVRSYIILTKNLKSTDIEITDENGDLSTFPVKNSSNKISFEFDGENPDEPTKVIFNIDIDTNFDETTAIEKILTDDNIPKLNALQNEAIKSEIEKIIEKSKSTDADFLNLGGTFAVQHPYKWHVIEKNWGNIFKNLDYEIKVSTKIKRYYNINSYDDTNNANTV